MKRRDFLSGLAVTSATLATAQATKGTVLAQTKDNLQVPRASSAKNILICSHNGYKFIDGGYEKLRSGTDTLESAITVVTGPEDDPNDDSVGYGGLPNEEGVVELDACCMHGPTRRAGAVGGVRDIKNVASVARAVMEHTGHVMLVGEGATRFAMAMGFPKQDLLTEHSRKIWLLWKETHSNQDWWGPGLSDPNWKPPLPLTADVADQPAHLRKMYAAAADLGIPEQDRMDAIHKVLHPPTGTINCSALNEKGEMSSVTTTAGLAWKLPGRCGDSPIIGAGCYCDQDIGAAGATGNGEENIKVVGAHTIVENMRRGMSPEEAGMDALKRISRNYNHDKTKLAYLGMIFYILRRDGQYACVSLWSNGSEKARQFVVHDGAKRAETAKFLYEGSPKDWPPTPRLPT
jgi:N4-(beta-N-acetylglucosaminyl)-L-asparaginase